VIETRPGEGDVLASAFALVEIDEVGRLRAGDEPGVFSPEEEAYAGAKSDPERRLAARYAAKRAACELLGSGAAPREVEVVRGRYGPPRLRLHGRALERMRELGAGSALVSLTHERRHAAAVVLLLRGEG